MEEFQQEEREREYARIEGKEKESGDGGGLDKRR